MELEKDMMFNIIEKDGKINEYLIIEKVNEKLFRVLKLKTGGTPPNSRIIFHDTGLKTLGET